MNSRTQLDLPGSLIDEQHPKMRGQIRQPTLLLMQLLAGRSILTAQSTKTGNRYTLRFSRPDAQPNRPQPIWVSLYGGSGGYLAKDVDRRAWTFLGTIWPALAGAWRYNPSKNSPITNHGAPEHRAIVWITCHLPAHVDVLMEEAEWWHEGVCGRCGRRLTVPTSIESGFGPDCLERVGRS